MCCDNGSPPAIFADRVLPDEQRLGAVFGASRNAVREALGLLRAEGLITRRPGVGTTVVMPKYGHGIDRLAGLAEVLTGYGTVTNQARVAEVVPRAPVGIAERLELPPGAGDVRIERLRRLDGCADWTGCRCRWTPAISPPRSGTRCWAVIWLVGTCSP